MNDFTLVVYSYNRHKYLIRLLEFYAKYDLCIIILDATPNPLETDFLNKKNIQYYHMPNAEMADRIAFGFEKVNTKYMSFCADDDFIFVDAIKASCKFLDNNQDYVCAQGRVLTCNIYDDDKETIDFHYIKYCDFINKNYSNDLYSKFDEFISPYRHVCYAVHRIENIRDIQHNIIKYNIKKPSIIEFAHGVISTFNGKSKELDIIYHLRELIDDSLGRTDIAIKVLQDTNNEETIAFKKMFIDNAIEKYQFSALEAELLYDKFIINFKSFNKEFNLNNKRIHFAGFSNNSGLLCDKLTINSFYKAEKDIKNAEELIFKYNIPSGFKKNSTQINKKQVNQDIIWFIKSIQKLFDNIDKNIKIAIYGAGTITKLILELYKDLNISFIIDNNQSLHNTNISNISVLSLEALKDTDKYDVIVITALGHETDIKKLLKELNIKQSILEI